LEGKGETQIFCGNALITFREAFEEVTKVDVDICASFDTDPDLVEQILECWWKGVFESWGK
jgi:hypothetical protein